MGSEEPLPRRRRSMVLRKRLTRLSPVESLAPPNSPWPERCKLWVAKEEMENNNNPTSPASGQQFAHAANPLRQRLPHVFFLTGPLVVSFPVTVRGNDLHASRWVTLSFYHGIPIWDNARICLTLNLQHRWAVSVHLPLVFYPSKLPAATPRIDSANLNHWVDLRTVSGSPSFSIKSMPLNIKTLHAKLCWGGGVSDHITD